MKGLKMFGLDYIIASNFRSSVNSLGSGTYRIRRVGSNGFDYSPYNKSNGYFVAVTKNDLTLRRFSELMVAEGLLGVWIDPKTGVREVDATLWVESLEDAIRVGREFDQKAIWDCKANKEVWL